MPDTLLRDIAIESSLAAMLRRISARGWQLAALAMVCVLRLLMVHSLPLNSDEPQHLHDAMWACAWLGALAVAFGGAW